MEPNWNEGYQEMLWDSRAFTPKDLFFVYMCLGIFIAQHMLVFGLS